MPATPAINAVAVPQQQPAAADTTHEAGHLPALDGIRGLFMLLIIFTHLHLLGAAWIGVQVFFVMSGFLITRLLLRDAETLPARAYFRNFYIRRALRIFPIFYLYLLALMFASRTLPEFDAIAPQLPFVATYTSNFYMTTAAEALDSRANWLIAHLWSLCVEEHFYLFWPAVVYFVGRTRLLPVCLALFVAGPAMRLAIHAAWPALPIDGLADNVARVVYVLTPSHIDAFATGALASLLPAPRLGRRALWLFAGLLAASYGLGALVNGWGLFASGPHGQPLTLGFPVHMPAGFQFVWGYTLINTLSAALLMLALHQADSRRFFSQAWLRYAGRISYGMYIYHMSVILGAVVICEYIGFNLNSAEARLAISPLVLTAVFAIAHVSYRYFEKPFLDMKAQFAPHAAHAG